MNDYEADWNNLPRFIKEHLRQRIDIRCKPDRYAVACTGCPSGKTDSIYVNDIAQAADSNGWYRISAACAHCGSEMNDAKAERSLASGQKQARLILRDSLSSGSRRWVQWRVSADQTPTTKKTSNTHTEGTTIMFSIRTAVTKAGTVGQIWFENKVVWESEPQQDTLDAENVSVKVTAVTKAMQVAEKARDKAIESLFEGVEGGQ